MRRMIGLIMCGQLQTVAAQGQGPDTLPLLMPHLAPVTDSARAAMPASHQSADTTADVPVRVIYCPEPPYPAALAEYGFHGSVNMWFVIDTSGRAELNDLTIKEASHVGFVEPARRAIAKCRYRPARKNGRPVRFLVQQRVNYDPEPRQPSP